MAFTATISPDDLKRGDLVDPGWYPCEISKYEEKDASTDKSTNAIFHFKVLDGAQKGNQFKTQFNEKALGFGKNLWAVLLGKPTDKGYALSSEVFYAQVGKKLMVYVKRGKNNDSGREFNEVADYRPLA